MHTVDDPRGSGRMAPHEQTRHHTAAEFALRVYPGPVGELVHRELCAYARFGHRFTRDALIPDLTNHILAQQASSPDCETAGGPEPRTPPTGAGPRPSGVALWPAPARGVGAQITLRH